MKIPTSAGDRPSLSILGARTLGNALGSGRNSLNALRLVFAAAVIVSHSWWLGGYGPEPSLYGIKLGTAGVMGFFAISGYLITVSAERSDTVLEYAAARLARIYPALVVAALAVAFVAAPLGALLTHGTYDLRGALAFLGAALALSVGVMDTPAIGTSLWGNNDRFDWNGPLWTLTWEGLCYVIIAIVVFLLRRLPGSRRGTATAIFLLFAASTGAVFGKLLAGSLGPNRTEFALPLLAIFMAGSLLATQRHRVLIGAVPSLLAVLAVLGALATGYGTALAPLPFAYLVLSIGSIGSASAIGSRYDISYGIYIYGWPIQQLLAAAHTPAHVPVLGFAALALVAAWPLGFLSCVAVEQPAQRVRRALVSRLAARVAN
ncbi:acyltransferase family protein [Arthrobacter sp. KNU-44]|uniref:acyltransferase family protein n=1 Tax=unclassified Arthrobacter TaxID=235627 RepID=UPI003F41E41D